MISRIGQGAFAHARGQVPFLFPQFHGVSADLGVATQLFHVHAGGEDAFKVWGWRVPFLVSILLLGISFRMQLSESPVFLKMKGTGSTSKAPLTEAFARWGNLKIVIICLLRAVMGQAVVWYTGQFYALFFLERTLRVDGAKAEVKKNLSAAGYPDKANPETINKPMVVLILFILVVYVTMVYGPIAALLVELFPARIRYSAMSLPYS